MPQLPGYLAQEALPASTGVRSGAFQVPTVGQPGVAETGPTALERSLTVPGEALQQVGALMVQTEELQAHRQKAFEALNAKTAESNWRIPMQQQAAQLLQENYQTYPDRLREEGDKLIQEHAAHLTPYGRAIFEAGAREHLAVMYGRALEERTKRTGQETAYQFTKSIQEAQKDYANATNDYERTVAKGRLEETARLFVSTGLVDGQAAANAVQKTFDAMADQQVQTAIQAYPDQMKVQLLAQAKGEPTRDDLPLARPENLAALTQQAIETSRARFAESEHMERYQDYQRQKQQTKNSVDARVAIWSTQPTPENVVTFQRIMEQVGIAMKQGDIDPVTGEHLMHQAATLSNAAKAPRTVDDPETERTMRLAVQTAETPKQFADARAMLTKIMETPNPKLKPETFSTLADKLEQREKAAYWRELPEVKAAKDVIMRGALVPYGGTLAGQMKPLMQQKLTFAMDQFESQIEALMADPQAGPRLVRQQAMQLAWEARRVHLKPDINNRADAQEYLPPEVQQATTPQELAQAIHALRMLGWSNGSLLLIRDNWHTWQDYLREEQAPRPGGVRAPLASTPKSYQLPGTTPTSSSEPRSK